MITIWLVSESFSESKCQSSSILLFWCRKNKRKCLFVPGKLFGSCLIFASFLTFLQHFRLGVLLWAEQWLRSLSLDPSSLLPGSLARPWSRRWVWRSGCSGWARADRGASRASPSDGPTATWWTGTASGNPGARGGEAHVYSWFECCSALIVRAWIGRLSMENGFFFLCLVVQVFSGFIK